MTIKPNIGILNALIRIAFGFTVLAWTTAKMVKRPWRDSYLFVTFIAAMKIAEGIVRFCPFVALFENLNENRQNQNSQQNNEIDTETILPYNPS